MPVTDEPAIKPIVAQKAPYEVEVVAGKTYYWCVCGRSAKQPLCDGSHKITSFTPLAYTAAKSGKLWFCGCKGTGNAPLCDGSHKRL
jgi:CDGSH iron-sulfur domain-containing protein 3